MTKTRQADPTPEDVADSVWVYAHEHKGMGGADCVEIRRHSSGDYIHHEWGTDPDHGQFDSIRWIPAADGPQHVATVRAADNRRYQRPEAEHSGPLAVFGVLVLIACVVGGVVLLIGRAFN